MDIKRENIHQQLNSGFSLVEVVISVAILAIAVTPLISAFALSSRTNAKAQSIQNATSLAESIMEEVKGATVEELEDNAAYGKVTDTTKNYASFAALTPGAQAAYAVSKIPSGKDGVLIRGEEGFYIFSKKEASSNSGEKYDVVATIDTKQNYSSAVGGSASDANSIELPKLERVDTGSNAAISTEINKYDDSAVATLIELYFDKHPDEYSDFASNTALYTPTNQTKTVSIKLADSGTNMTSVDCEVKYEAAIKGISVKFTRNIYSGTFSDFTDSTGANYPSDAYVFYTTVAQLLDDTNILNENIVITNTGRDRKLYLVMQNDEYYSEGSSGSPVLQLGSGNIVVNGTTKSKTFKITLNSTVLNANSDLDSDGHKTVGNIELISNIPKTVSATDTVHIYDTESDDYIYEINVKLTKNNEDTVYAELTSTKQADGEKDAASIATPTGGPEEDDEE